MHCPLPKCVSPAELQFFLEFSLQCIHSLTWELDWACNPQHATADSSVHQCFSLSQSDHLWLFLCQGLKRGPFPLQILMLFITNGFMFHLYHSGIPNTPYDLLAFNEEVRNCHISSDPMLASPLLLHCRFAKSYRFYVLNAHLFE